MTVEMVFGVWNLGFRTTRMTVWGLEIQESDYGALYLAIGCWSCVSKMEGCSAAVISFRWKPQTKVVSVLVAKGMTPSLCIGADDMAGQRACFFA